MADPARQHICARLLLEAFGTEPFSVAAAEARGIPSHRLRAAERAGRLRRLRRGWYVLSEPGISSLARTGEAPLAPIVLPASSIGAPTVDAIPRDCLAAVDRLRDRSIDAVMTGSAGCLAWGVDLVGRPPPVLLVPASSGVRAGMQGSVLIRHDEPPEEHVVRMDDGRLIASPARSALDAARGLSDLAAYVTLNSATRVLVGVHAVAELHRSVRTTPGRSPLADWTADPERARRAIEELQMTRAGLRGHGVRRLACLFRLLEPRLESALESVSWWRFDEFGLPMPIPQAWVRGSSGRLYRVDFLWGALVGEADGLGKYRDEASLIAEKRRQTDIELPGKSLIRWGWREAWHHPDRLARDVLRRLEMVSS